MNHPDFEQQVHAASRTVDLPPGGSDALLDQLRAIDALLASLPAPPEEPSLIYRDPGGSTRLRPIGTGLVFGRSSGCDIHFTAHREISQRHFEITYRHPDFVLRDLGSTNGTFVNGEQITVTEHLLLDGDLIRVAAFHFAFIRSHPSDSL
jgi:adenylate cyclase